MKVRHYLKITTGCNHPVVDWVYPPFMERAASGRYGSCPRSVVVCVGS